MSRLLHQARQLSVGAACALTQLVLGPSAMAYPSASSPFLYAIAGYTDPSGIDSSTETVATSGSAIAAFSGPGGSTARADFGSIGYKYTSTGSNTASWPFGVSSDGFVISGSSGTGTIHLSASIHGSAGGDWDQGYSLFVSSSPFSLEAVLEQWYAEAANCPPDTGCDYDIHAEGATRLLNRIVNNGDSPANAILTADLEFEYGTPFYLLAFFGGDGNAGVDFYNSAAFGLSAPFGASVSTLSGAVYAAAVPEPTTMALVLFCLAAVGMRRSVSSTKAPLTDSP